MVSLICSLLIDRLMEAKKLDDDVLLLEQTGKPGSFSILLFKFSLFVAMIRSCGGIN